jgi:hypothetical protein
MDRPGRRQHTLGPPHDPVGDGRPAAAADKARDVETFRNPRGDLTNVGPDLVRGGS